MHTPSVAFVCLCLALGSLMASASSWAEEAVYPEGSSSIIETRSWQLSATDPLALQSQTRAAVAQMDGVVVVKDEAGLLVLSLPTPLLAALRERLSALGALHIPAETPAPQAPTTLLRVRFQAASDPS